MELLFWAPCHVCRHLACYLAEHNWRGLMPDPLKAEGLPWYSSGTGSGVVLGGGAVVSLLHPHTKPSDYDLFLVVPSNLNIQDPSKASTAREEAARELVDKILKSLVASCQGPTTMFVEKSPNVVDILILSS